MGLHISQNPKVEDLIKLLVESEGYDEDFVKVLLEVTATEWIAVTDKEYELKNLEFENKPKFSNDDSSASSLCKQWDLLKLMAHFDDTGNIIVYLSLFERQICRMNIIKENWVLYFLSLLPLKITNILARDPGANDFDNVKTYS